jgi:hypothetical protein
LLFARRFGQYGWQSGKFPYLEKSWLIKSGASQKWTIAQKILEIDCGLFNSVISKENTMKELFFAIALVLTSLPVLATNTPVPTEINIPQSASISSEVGPIRLPIVVAGISTINK